jgi:hypothetical protein
MEDQEAKAAPELARFAAEVALEVNYLLGPVVVGVFLVGSWWGARP